MTSEAELVGLREALQKAAELVAELPGDIRAVAFTEAFRTLYHEPVGDDPALRPPVRRPVQREAAGHVSRLPDDVAVKSGGSRLTKVLYAVARITEEGAEATPTEIDRFLREKLATVIKGNKTPTVVNEATPQYLTRRKIGRTYAYELTGPGWDALSKFANPD